MSNAYLSSPGGYPKLEISKETFEEITTATDFLNECTDLEQKLFVVVEAYIDLERFLFDACLKEMFMNYETIAAMARMSVDFNYKVNPFLMSSDAYITNIAGHLRKLRLPEEARGVLINSLSQYKDSQYWLIQTTFRNFAGHRAFVASSYNIVSNPGGAIPSHFEPRRFLTPEFYFDTEELTRDNRIKAKDRIELKRLGARIEIVGAIRRHAAWIFDYHSELRRALRNSVDGAKIVRQEQRQKWSDETGHVERGTGLVAHQGERNIPLSMSLEEYYDHIIKKTIGIAFAKYITVRSMG